MVPPQGGLWDREHEWAWQEGPRGSPSFVRRSDRCVHSETPQCCSGQLLPLVGTWKSLPAACSQCWASPTLAQVVGDLLSRSSSCLGREEEGPLRRAEHIPAHATWEFVVTRVTWTQRPCKLEKKGTYVREKSIPFSPDGVFTPYSFQIMNELFVSKPRQEEETLSS